MSDVMTAPALLFEAAITPQRSLSRRGRFILVGAIGAACAADAVAFSLIGAWPVAGFAGIELVAAALLLALHANAGKASELLLLDERELRIVRTTPRGQREVITLPPAWLTVSMTERPGRVPRLALRTHGRETEIATQLGETAKADLAEAVRAALERWRAPAL